jgi:hypothetical protein
MPCKAIGLENAYTDKNVIGLENAKYDNNASIAVFFF